MKNSKLLKGIHIIAIVMIAIGATVIFPENNVWYHDILQYILTIGMLVNGILLVYRYDGGKRNGKIAIGVLLFATSITIKAQDYTPQIEAFTKSFAEKDATYVSAHASTALQFGSIPATNTPAILKNIVTNLPKLNSMTILEKEEGRALVKYDFVGLGIRESNILFDKAGKITKIELVENLIRMEQEAQRQQQQSVQLPTPGPLGEKYLPKKIEFTATDGLIINGNLYEIGEDKPTILLCHQAGYNRVEYADIAPKLNDLGYNCMAIDQRSGGPFAGKPNGTATHALDKGLQPEMHDAQQDITAAVAYLKEKYGRDIIIWGSSYSSSLALLEAHSNVHIKAVIAFSPGDYFGDARASLATVFAEIKKPYLVTSSQQEAKTLAALIGTTAQAENQTQFVPDSKGFHGSRAVWTGQEGAEEYWTAVLNFLKTL